MAESKSDPPSSGKDVKAPNVFERVKEEFEAVLHNEKQGHHHHKETHGLRDDIDVNTSASDVKAPNVFERAKEEIEAIVGVIHGKKGSRDSDLQLSGETRDSAKKDTLETEKSGLYAEKNNIKAPTIDVKAKEGSISIGHKPHHHKETHGKSCDFDENTPISELKGPNVFERAKEEIEALVHTIHHKKDSDNDASSAKKKEKNNVKAPTIDVKAKEESTSIGHKPHHHKETHGKSHDFDENTPISEFKGPNVFERAKEEIEALVHTIHHKKDSGSDVSSGKKKGWLEKICSPRGHNSN